MPAGGSRPLLTYREQQAPTDVQHYWCMLPKQSAILQALAKQPHLCIDLCHRYPRLSNTQPLAVCTMLRPRPAGADACSLPRQWNYPPVCTTLRPRKQVCPVSCSRSACTRRSRANSLHMRPWKACSLLCSRGPRNIQQQPRHLHSRTRSTLSPGRPDPCSTAENGDHVSLGGLSLACTWALLCNCPWQAYPLICSREVQV